MFFKRIGLVLLFSLSCFAAPLQAQSLKAKDIRGVYSFAWASHILKQGMPPSVDLDYVDGMTLCMQWRELNPEPNVYRWELIDPVLEQAAKAGKRLNLGIFAGMQSPRWVMDQLENPMRYQRKIHDGEVANNAPTVATFPLPWDQTYMRHWLDLNRKLAARYMNHPAVGYLQIHGIAGSAMEMSIRLDPSEYDNLRQAGYSVARYTECWKKLVDDFAVIWPDKPLMLTLGTVPADHGDELVADTALAVEQYAYEKLGDRLLVKVAFLNGKWWNNNRGHAKPLIDLLKELGASSRCVGGEMFWKLNVTGQAAVAGDMDRALQNAADAHMQLVEVYQDDIAGYREKKVFEPFVPMLRKAHERMNVTPLQ
jgi:hypothetical protein